MSGGLSRGTWPASEQACPPSVTSSRGAMSPAHRTRGGLRLQEGISGLGQVFSQRKPSDSLFGRVIVLVLASMLVYLS